MGFPDCSTGDGSETTAMPCAAASLADRRGAVRSTGRDGDGWSRRCGATVRRTTDRRPSHVATTHWAHNKPSPRVERTRPSWRLKGWKSSVTRCLPGSTTHPRKSRLTRKTGTGWPSTAACQPEWKLAATTNSCRPSVSVVSESRPARWSRSVIVPGDAGRARSSGVPIARDAGDEPHRRAALIGGRRVDERRVDRPRLRAETAPPRSTIARVTRRIGGSGSATGSQRIGSDSPAPGRSARKPTPATRRADGSRKSSRCAGTSPA